MDQRRPFLTYQTIFSYRGLWMFAAIVCVTIFHAPIGMPAFLGILPAVKDYAFVAVDVFLFASGIGCAWSLKKGGDLLSFFRRRAVRILPVYYLCLIPWFVYCGLTRQLTLEQALGNLLGHGVLANLDNQFNWYVACMWLCYFCAPFFMALARRYPGALPRAAITAALAALALCFRGQFQMILWTRVPVFFLGICLGETSLGREGITGKQFLAALAGVVLGFGILVWLKHNRYDLLDSWGLWWYPCILITPGLCFGLSWLANLADRTPLRVLVKLGCQGGSYTFAFCLLHVLVFDIYSDLAAGGVIRRSWPTFALALAAALLASALAEWFGFFCKEALFRSRRKT